MAMHWYLLPEDALEELLDRAYGGELAATLVAELWAQADQRRVEGGVDHELGAAVTVFSFDPHG